MISCHHLFLNGVKLASSSYFPNFQFQGKDWLTHSGRWVLVQVIVSQEQAVEVASCSSGTMRVLPEIPNAARAKVATREVRNS